MKKVIVIVLVVVLVGGGLYWLMNRDDSDSTDTTTGNSTTHTDDHEHENGDGTEATATDKVDISEMSFLPANITVKKGTTVTWTNNDTTMHTVTSDEGSLMDSEDMNPGDTYSVTFNEAGTFGYHCAPHPFMTGSVTVTE